MNNFLAARSQMGMSLGFHIIFAVIGMALPMMMSIAEWRWRTTADPVYLLLAKQGSLLPVQVSLIVVGWGVAQYPFIVRTGLSIYNSASATNVLLSIEVALALGALVLIPSLLLLLFVFKANPNSVPADAGDTH
jgi:cytochrome bd-type quinol oxidase subunit 1